MHSRRIPDLTPTPWSQQLDAARRDGPLLDLTESNPTAVGLGGAGPAELAALADPRAAFYTPEPLGLRSAREAVATAMVTCDFVPDPDDVVLTASTSEAYSLLFATLCEPGDVVLAPRPSYPLLEPIAALAGVRIEPWRLAWDGRWHLDDGALESAIASAGNRARALVTVEPNNPTGTCLTQPERAILAARCAQAGLVLISDEVFRYAPRPGHREPLPTWIANRALPAVVLGGLSKMAGMPQMKVAWMVLGGPEAMRTRMREKLAWVSDLFLSVATPMQLALPGLLAAGPRFQTALGARLQTNLARLQALTAGHPQVSVLDAEGGWVAIVRLPQRHDAEGWALALLEHGVAVHPGDLYDLELPACVVISLLPEPAVFDAACIRLETLLDT